MRTRNGDGNAGSDPPEPAFWGQLFAGLSAPVIVADGPGGSSTPQPEILLRRRKTWVDRLFAGEESYANSPDKIVILQNGVEIEDVPIDPLGSWTVVGRHPRAHIQLEAYKLGLFHAAFHKKDGRFYLRAIDLECGTLLDRKKIKAGVPVPLRDGSLVDIPGYQLRIRLANSPATAGEEIVEAEELAETPSYFYVPPPSSLVRTNLIEDRAAITLWSGGVTSLKVADIIEETADAKTFRLVGEKPLLFSYRPGQFVTLLLTIDGEYIERSYIQLLRLSGVKDAVHRRRQRDHADDVNEPLDRRHNRRCGCDVPGLVQIACGHHFPQGARAHLDAACLFPRGHHPDLRLSRTNRILDRPH